MLFFKKKIKKPTVVAIHGFGVRGIHEFENLKNALLEKDYDFKTIQMFDIEDQTDTDWTAWVSKAKDLITDVAYYNDIVLVGFSMGGVIASYLANSYRVKKLVLLAPSFEYLTPSKVIDNIPKPFVKEEKPKMPSNFTPAFMDVVSNCKDSINDISVPTLMIHCENDEVIPLSSSEKNIKKIPVDNKALITISEGQHRILDDKIAGPIAISNIISFIENDILF
ncbi:MAG: alpha/beta fold hydrolase [Erysipelotrichaceae bacterium]